MGVLICAAKDLISSSLEASHGDLYTPSFSAAPGNQPQYYLARTHRINDPFRRKKYLVMRPCFFK